jgi:CheY-like chemotaxis protein
MRERKRPNAPGSRVGGKDARTPTRYDTRGIDLTSVRVLVVADRADALDVLTTFLRYAGAIASPASSANEALRNVAKAAPDVIVCDLAARRAISFARSVRCDCRTQAARMIAVGETGAALAEQQAMNAGFDAFLQKPLDPVALCRTIASLVPEQDEMAQSGETGTDSGHPDTRVA